MTETFAFGDIVDIEELRALFESFSQITGFTTGLVDQMTSEVLIATGWHDICVEFFRADAAAVEHCKASNMVLTYELKTPGQVKINQCFNGLMDGATPIIIEGYHLANLFSGQVLFAEPDLKVFKARARQYGFDEQRFLAALANVPIVEEKIFVETLQFLSHLAVIVARMGLVRKGIIR